MAKPLKPYPPEVIASIIKAIKILMDNAITREDGQLLLSARYGPDGWEYARDNYDYERGRFVPYRLQELAAHLYHASMAQEDYVRACFHAVYTGRRRGGLTRA